MLAPHGDVYHSFKKPIFIRLTVTQQIVVNMFCTGVYLDRRKNLENSFIFFIYTLSYSMASTAPILINLVLTKQHYVKIFCTQVTQIHQEICNERVEIN